MYGVSSLKAEILYELRRANGGFNSYYFKPRSIDYIYYYITLSDGVKIGARFEKSEDIHMYLLLTKAVERIKEYLHNKGYTLHDMVDFECRIEKHAL